MINRLYWPRVLFLLLYPLPKSFASYMVIVRKRGNQACPTSLRFQLSEASSLMTSRRWAVKLANLGCPNGLKGS